MNSKYIIVNVRYPLTIIGSMNTSVKAVNLNTDMNILLTK